MGAHRSHAAAWRQSRGRESLGLLANEPSRFAGGLDGLAVIAVSTPAAATPPTGTVVGWGNNNYGRMSPPAGLAGVTVIAAGENRSFALTSDGTVVGWGDNTDGQASPPAGLAGVTAIFAGLFHSLAVKSDGTVFGWGNNDSGQTSPCRTDRGDRDLRRLFPQLGVDHCGGGYHPFGRDCPNRCRCSGDVGLGRSGHVPAGQRTRQCCRDTPGNVCSGVWDHVRARADHGYVHGDGPVGQHGFGELPRKRDVRLVRCTQAI